VRGLALAGGLALALALAEGLVRLLAPQVPTPLLAGFDPPGIVRPDDRYGWTLTPGFRGTGLHGSEITISSLGFRDREYGPKRDDEVRILSLGDSFAFGMGVELEATYGRVLERRLQARFPSVRITVINTGTTGWSQPQMILAVADLRERLAPDLALATFVAGNDVAENAQFEERLVQRVKTPLGPLGRRSHAVRLLARTLFPVTERLANRWPPYVGLTIALLGRLEAELAADGLPAVMLVIPARHQVRPGTEPAVAVLHALGLDAFLFYQNRRVVEHFVAAQVPYVDATAALAARDPVAPVMFDDDAHTNALGHEIMADLVYERMEGLVALSLRARAAARAR
jgi:lysophospholipase L1-like esterase